MSPQQPTPPTGPDDSAELVDFSVDLTSQEVLRRAQVMAALGPDWDPIEVLRGEDAAYDLLYSGLDEAQQRLYDDLVAAGVLPRRETAVLPLDPQADIGRRAWVPCPHCHDTRDCGPCSARGACSTHWRYLLSNTGSLLHLQCPGCTHVWVHESGFGATRSSLWDRITGGQRRL